MIRHFFLFDLRLQKSSPLLWMTVLLFSLMAFFSAESIGLGGAIGNAYTNSAAITLQKTAIFTLMSMFFITLFIAQPLLRDHEQGVADMFFSKPMRKRDYVLGRFCAGFAISAALFAFMLSMMDLGMRMPWTDAARVGPHTLAPFVFAYFVIVIPNLLFMGGALALLAVVTRSILAVYVGIVAMLALWGAAQGMLNIEDSRTLVILLDPTGLQALSSDTRYWLLADFNSRIPPLSAMLLINRLIWGTLGLSMLGLAVAMFQSRRSGTGKAWLKRAKPAAPAASAVVNSAVHQRRRFTPATGARVAVRQFLHLSAFHIGGIVKSTAFLAFVLLGVFLYVTNLNGNMNFMGVPQYPITSWTLEIATKGMGLFLSIIIIFYSGELFDKERAAKLHEVSGACPTPDLLPLLAKCTALIAAAIAYIGAMAAAGIVFQLAHGYTSLEAKVYAGGLLLEVLPYVSFAVLALALQAFARQKYVGYMLIGVLLMLRLNARTLGVEDNLLVFGGAPMLEYSDMNGYGNNLIGHLAFQVYWFLFAASMLMLAASTSVRGTVSTWRQRLARAPRAMRGGLGVALGACALLFIGAGAALYSNTHVLNAYRSSKQMLDLREAYEREYAATATMAQAKITKADVTLDMSPRAKSLALTVRYTVTNTHPQAISDVHLLVSPELSLDMATLAFAQQVREDARFGLHVLRLNTPLAPGASAVWELRMTQRVRGFGNNGDAGLVLENGTFLHSYRVLPSFGYNLEGRIKNPQERAKRHLPALAAAAKLEDMKARNVAFNVGEGVDPSDDADWIDFNTVVSTDADQLALAPGQLQKEWTKDGRRYFHYAMQGKMDFYAAWLSGRWSAQRDSWNGVPIEVYFDPKHAYNAARMVSTAKASLAYFNEAFSPYQQKELRIVEFPKTVGQFAESFAGTVPFSESAGFIADVRDPDSFDIVSYITAHEVAHQWWGHQVLPASVQGATMVVESLAQYSAFMLVQKQIGKARMRPFLRRELDGYLIGRGRDRQGEQPLLRVENQQYIHYSKGSLAFYRLADEVGEDAVNRALKKFLAAAAYRAEPFPTSDELIGYLRAEAGPQHQGLITDLFEKISLYDNRVLEAKAVKRKDGRYEVSMTVSAAKFYADSKGKEVGAPIDDWMDVAVFARAPGAAERDEKVLKLEHRHITRDKQTIRFTVDEKPFEVGIDPYNKLIDRVSGDNRMRPVIE
ncbi:MAG: hypothetical protein V4582_06725 [Pseudomonadota bacterium]